MTVINITNARQNLYKLISDVNSGAEPVTIINNKGKNAVMISEDDWRSIEETLYLNQVPGMADSILKSAQEPLTECRVYEDDETW